MTRTDRITAALQQKLNPTFLKLEDESARHAEHVENPGGGGTHYNLIVESSQFAGINKVKRHQMIYAALGNEFQTGLHAFSIQAYAPGERK